MPTILSLSPFRSISLSFSPSVSKCTPVSQQPCKPVYVFFFLFLSSISLSSAFLTRSHLFLPHVAVFASSSIIEVLQIFTLPLQLSRAVFLRRLKICRC